MFELGRIVATMGASLTVRHEDIQIALARHHSGDWGDLCEEDVKTNNEAVSNRVYPSQILSSYKDRNGVKFWIITEADRSVTTVLLPSEY